MESSEFNKQIKFRIILALLPLLTLLLTFFVVFYSKVKGFNSGT